MSYNISVLIQFYTVCVYNQTLFTDAGRVAKGSSNIFSALNSIKQVRMSCLNSELLSVLHLYLHRLQIMEVWNPFIRFFLRNRLLTLESYSWTLTYVQQIALQYLKTVWLKNRNGNILQANLNQNQPPSTTICKNLASSTCCREIWITMD